MCDHVCEYKVYSRMVGYTPVCVYLCQRCGADMAMDTLPQHLLKRMWGNLDRSFTSSSVQSRTLVPVDVCVVFCGKIAKQCARIMFYSLSKVITTLEGVTFHLVNQDIPDEEFVDIASMVPGCKTYKRPSIPTLTIQGPGLNYQRPYGLVDAEWSDDWMVRNCGTNQFVVLLHFDLFFCADFLTYLRAEAKPDTALLGQQCPFIMVNRDAYKQSVFGFRTAGPFVGVTLPEQPDQFWLYHEGDERIEKCRQQGSKILRTSFDTGELLELELRTYGWKCKPMREIFTQYFYHFSAAGHIDNDIQMADITRRMNMFINEYSIPENPRLKL